MDATCTVSFYLDSVSEENLIYRAFEVFVPAGGSTVVSHDWLASVAGNHTIIVNITDSNPSETDLANNQASKEISIIKPCGKLKVKASSDKQKYVSGVDDHADIIVKVTYLGELISGASVSAWVIDPVGTNTSVPVSEVSEGIYVGIYPFTNASPPGTYRIKAIASKPGYINGENNDCKDKFFLDSPDSAGGISVSPSVAFPGDTVRIQISGNGIVRALLRDVVNGVGYCVPVLDDGTHGDTTPSDGTFTYELNAGELRDGYYTLDVISDDIIFECQGALSIAPSDKIMMDTIHFSSSGCSALINSTLTNITITLSLAEDITDVSIVIFEHRTASEGKYYDIIPDDRVEAAMSLAELEVSYVAEDIPSGVNEEEMLIHLYNPYIGGYEPCIPGGVYPLDDVIWGDIDHFSRFLASKVPIRFGVNVHKGWNLLSIPLVTNSTNLTDVLSDCGMGTSWSRAMYYDPSDSPNHWKQYNTGWAKELNELNTLEPGMSVWVYIEDPKDLLLVVEGTLPDNTTISLHTGWNMIGYPARDDSTYTVGQLKADTGATIVEVFDPDAEYKTAVLPDNYVLKRGEGYWVYVPADTTWTVNW
ncbi:MAG: choice-of-anchor X domain-containing protein [Candidatus Thermoplasmatota archaeon]